jgi:hypothetical protein
VTSRSSISSTARSMSRRSSDMGSTIVPPPSNAQPWPFFAFARSYRPPASRPWHGSARTVSIDRSAGTRIRFRPRCGRARKRDRQPTLEPPRRARGRNGSTRKKWPWGRTSRSSRSRTTRSTKLPCGRFLQKRSPRSSGSRRCSANGARTATSAE